MSAQMHLGIDVGTTATKAVVFDCDGTVHAQESVHSAVVHSKAGWSSQTMSGVWDTVVKTLRSICEQVSPELISSIGVCGQGDGLWLLDENCHPIRNAILWNDQRANDYVRSWMDDGTSDRLSKTCRTAIWAGSSAAIFRWLKDNEPENAMRARHALCCKDWINFKLTGELTTDFSDASIPFLDLESRAFVADAFEMLGVQELHACLPEPQSATTLNGRMTAQAALETGLLAGTPVAVGCIDLASMVSGMGLDKTGDICLVLGTTGVVAAVVDPEPFTTPPAGATLVHPYQENWIKVLAPLSGASALDWFTSMDEGNFGGKNSKETAERLNGMAAGVPPGANGVMFLPFLTGERAPFVAPHATASFLGITASTSQADMARAVMEGVALSLRHCFEATGLENPGQVFLTGGGARNQLWCDIIASVMNTRIVASDASDHGVWGVAIIGAKAAGLVEAHWPPVRVETTRSHKPDPSHVARYESLYSAYEKCVASSAVLWDAGRDRHATGGH